MLRQPAILIAAVLTLLLPATSTAFEMKVAGFLGGHQPIDQGDTTDDLHFGGGVSIPAWRGFRVEPEVTYYDLDREPYRARGVPQEVQEWSMVAAGLDVTWVADELLEELNPYVTAGMGMYFLRKYEAPDENHLGFRWGAGFLVNMKPDVELDVRAGLTRIGLEQGGSRGFASLRVGLLYTIPLE